MKEPHDPLQEQPDEGVGDWKIELLVDELRQARYAQNEWRGAENTRRPRPSRDALLSIVNNLRAVLFPTHFGGSDFDDASLDFFVGHTLAATLRALEEQLRRGLGYSPAFANDDAATIAWRAHEITGAFAASLPRVRSALELDVRAAYEADPAAQSRSEVIFCYPGITALIHHRLAHELYRQGAGLLARVISEIAHSNTGIDIHPGAVIGESFFIDHGTGVVIGETAVLGKRVRLYQGVTLGARNFPRDERGVIKNMPRHPILEDDVVIYAGATILGRITIGHGSIVGGNVWITRSLPANSSVTQAQPRDEGFDHGAGI
jgi:serine O-acetyltransferase